MRLLHARLPHDGQRIIARHRAPSRLEIKEALSGNLCRCTGYSGIVDAVDEIANGKPNAV